LRTLRTFLSQFSLSIELQELQETSSNIQNIQIKQRAHSLLTVTHIKHFLVKEQRRSWLSGWKI